MNRFRYFLSKHPQYYIYLKHILLKLGVYQIFEIKQYINFKFDEDFRQRTADILQCKDLLKINFNETAGKLVWPYQYMHNGIKIKAGSYYHHGYTKLFELTKGVHEPQEEYAFQTVLPFIPNNAVMIELGAFWAFYSIWFKKEKMDASCYLLEPNLKALNDGKTNAQLNHVDLNFFQYMIGNTTIGNEENKGIDNSRIVSIDVFAIENEIQFIDLLHSDIQGYEFEMLEGAREMLKNHKIGFLFISTHSNEIHSKCKELIELHNYHILVDCNLNQTFSFDGIIVAKALSYTNLQEINIHKKNESN